MGAVYKIRLPGLRAVQQVLLIFNVKILKPFFGETVQLVNLVGSAPGAWKKG